MRDSGGVRGSQGARDLRGNFERAAQFQRPVFDPLAQCLAFDVLRDQIAPAVRLADLVDGDDVRVIQCRNGPRLALEASQSLRMGSKFGGHDLDRDLASERRILTEVDLTHSAPAQQRQDSIMAQHLSDLRRSWRIRHERVRRRLQEAADPIAGGDERSDLVPKTLIAGASRVEKGLPLIRTAFQGRVIQPLDLLPAFRRHHARPRPIHGRARPSRAASRA